MVIFITGDNKIGSHMALYYDLVLRGTINALNWAVVTHWRLVGSLGVLSEAQVCQALADMGVDFWDASGKQIVSTAVVLTKAVATAYDEPTGFFEQPAAIAGLIDGDSCPSFVSKGFRQFRSNSDFRTSTHRFPEVMEGNNVDGNWVFDASVTSPEIAAVEAWLGQPHTVTVPDTILEVVFQPILLRKQMTEGSDDNPPKVVTYFVPPQISDVASAAFYGITSQVSRKFILPS